MAATSAAELRFGTATSLFSAREPEGPEPPCLAFGGAAELWWFSMAGKEEWRIWQEEGRPTGILDGPLQPLFVLYRMANLRLCFFSEIF